MSQFVWLAVVGMEYPAVMVRARVPDVVMGLPETESPVGTVIATDVTVPVVLEVPAPMAVRKDAASSEETVLSALKRGNVTALGFVSV